MLLKLSEIKWSLIENANNAPLGRAVIFILHNQHKPFSICYTKQNLKITLNMAKWSFAYVEKKHLSHNNGLIVLQRGDY